MPLNEEFRKLSHRVAEATGTPGAFGIALLSIVIWLSTGPIFHFSDTWQLIINTSTTIITFLMVFLIQNAQNRDSRAIQLKLNELIRGVKGARTSLVDLEECSDEELREMQKEFHDLHVKLGTHLEERRSEKKRS
jgi:low affinity Fe/Cu permease